MLWLADNPTPDDPTPDHITADDHDGTANDYDDHHDHDHDHDDPASSGYLSRRFLHAWFVHGRVHLRE
jgi:hypothetical protein